jgi:formylglycine-generating enzyme required for sulfatase activity
MNKTNVPVPEMVLLKKGIFKMGTPDTEPGREKNEGPQREVTLNAFYISKYTITQKEFIAVMGFNPNGYDTPDLPMDFVNWYDAINYCNALSVSQDLKPVYTVKGVDVTWEKSANGYRLPTEAEWEYACRAGTTTMYYIDIRPQDIDKIIPVYANCTTDHTYSNLGRPAVGGCYPPNPWGLCDMMGNIYEWCWDWWQDGYTGLGTDNPSGPASGVRRTMRGGCWFLGAGGLRSGNRDNGYTNLRWKGNGIRLVKNS